MFPRRNASAVRKTCSENDRWTLTRVRVDATIKVARVNDRLYVGTLTQNLRVKPFETRRLRPIDPVAFVIDDAQALRADLPKVLGSADDEAVGFREPMADVFQ
jgi:hypothetical protein